MPEAPQPGAVLASLSSVSAVLGGKLVIDHVDLAVRAGEVLALVGPNGAGKSTLLALLTGDVPASDGSVAVEGRDLGTWTHRELALRRAVLPQQVVVSFPFTVEEVVRMGRAPWAGSPYEDLDDSAVAAAMAATDTRHLAHRTFPSLSGGERARVALARVLAQEPGLLLLDEPTAALDVHHQEMVMEVATSRAAAGVGVVVVVHDLALACAYADVVAVVDGGRVVRTGPPADVLSGELLSRVYHHEIEVVPHPVTGEPLVLPVRVRNSAPNRI